MTPQEAMALLRLIAQLAAAIYQTEPAEAEVQESTNGQGVVTEEPVRR